MHRAWVKRGRATQVLWKVFWLRLCWQDVALLPPVSNYLKLWYQKPLERSKWCFILNFFLIVEGSLHFASVNYVLISEKLFPGCHIYYPFVSRDEWRVTVSDWIAIGGGVVSLTSTWSLS